MSSFKIPGSCQRKGCANPAESVPVLNFRVHVAMKSDVAAPAYFFELPVCGEHRGEVSIEDLLPDAAWERLKAGFMAAGRAIPDRKRTTLNFVSIKQAEIVLESYHGRKP